MTDQERADLDAARAELDELKRELNERLERLERARLGGAVVAEPKTSQTYSGAATMSRHYRESFMAEFGCGSVSSGDRQPKTALNVHRTAGRGMTVRNTEWPEFGFGMSERESVVAEFKAKRIGGGHGQA